MRFFLFYYSICYYMDEKEQSKVIHKEIYIKSKKERKSNENIYSISNQLNI